METPVLVFRFHPGGRLCGQVHGEFSDESLSSTHEPEIYWLVDNIEAAFKELSQKSKIDFPLAQKPFGKVFGIKDPAGQAHFLLDFAQNRPSQVEK